MSYKSESALSPEELYLTLSELPIYPHQRSEQNAVKLVFPVKLGLRSFLFIERC